MSDLAFRQIKEYEDLLEEQRRETQKLQEKHARERVSGKVSQEVRQRHQAEEQALNQHYQERLQEQAKEHVAAQRKEEARLKEDMRVAKDAHRQDMGEYYRGLDKKNNIRPEPQKPREAKPYQDPFAQKPDNKPEATPQKPVYKPDQDQKPQAPQDRQYEIIAPHMKDGAHSDLRDDLQKIEQDFQDRKAELNPDQKTELQELKNEHEMRADHAVEDHHKAQQEHAQQVREQVSHPPRKEAYKENARDITEPRKPAQDRRREVEGPDDPDRGGSPPTLPSGGQRMPVPKREDTVRQKQPQQSRDIAKDQQQRTVRQAQAEARDRQANTPQQQKAKQQSSLHQAQAAARERQAKAPQQSQQQAPLKQAQNQARQRQANPQPKPRPAQNQQRRRR